MSSKSQTVISIRRDKVDVLRQYNEQFPNFFKVFMDVNHISNFPLYLYDAIFVSHSEFSSINACHMITPFLGATVTNSLHKSFEIKDDEKIWLEKHSIINNLIMGFKGEYEVKDIDSLEIESEFATAKNSVYSVFGLLNCDFNKLTSKDFSKILDIVEFKEKDKTREQKLIESLPQSISYMGSFAQRQVCLAFQSNGVFKAYPFKSNKNINLDTDELKKQFREEAFSINHRFSFASKEKKEELLLKYVASYDYREKLSNRLFEAFIDGLKGVAIPVIKEESVSQIKARKKREEAELDD